jgi:uncharacterized protein YcbK (DUF882 family)
MCRKRSSQWVRCGCFAVLLPLLAIFPAAAKSSSQKSYHLDLYNLHTGRSLHIVYRVGNHYLPSAELRLDRFLGDWRVHKDHDMNPRLFDLLYKLDKAVGHPGGPIDIVCGYRSPQTNAFLHRTTGGVAVHSMHVLGDAIDIRIPGVSTLALRNAALRLHFGGVGYYPEHHFVHVDVGRVREWEYPPQGS